MRVGSERVYCSRENSATVCDCIFFFEAACWKSGVVENSAGRVGFVGLSGKNFNFS